MSTTNVHDLWIEAEKSYQTIGQNNPIGTGNSDLYVYIHAHHFFSDDIFHKTLKSVGRAIDTFEEVDANNYKKTFPKIQESVQSALIELFSGSLKADKDITEGVEKSDNAKIADAKDAHFNIQRGFCNAAIKIVETLPPQIKAHEDIQAARKNIKKLIVDNFSFE